MPSHRLLLELTRRYTEPHRHYHDIEHIAWMLAFGREVTLSDAQLLAIWFHDAVYDPASATNEEDSARLAAELLGAEGYPRELIAVVERIVLDTKEHRPTIEPARLVVDLDLVSLSFPWERFTENGERVRREYAPVSDEQFEAGRRRLFEELLARERIYTTDWAAPRESLARANLRRVLAE